MSPLDHDRKSTPRPYKEAASNTIELPEDEPEVFGLFLTYLYQSEIRILEHCVELLKPKANLIPADEDLTKIRDLTYSLYIMMDRLDMRYWKQMEEELFKYIHLTSSKFEEGRKSVKKDYRHSPILPSTALKVLRCTVEQSRLRKHLLVELRDELVTDDHRPVAEYADCIAEFPEDFARMFENVWQTIQRQGQTKLTHMKQKCLEYHGERYSHLI